MSKSKIRKGDEVQVMTGRDRGARGRVLRVFPEDGTAIVERINMVKKHTRPNPQKQVQGGIVEREAPIQLSNLKVICPETGKPTKVGLRRLEDGTSVRVSKLSGATFN